MKQNPVQFQKGLSLTDFLLQYGTEEKCKAALFQWRWPDGYVVSAL
ncbi:MAG: transposase [gamma proteobacterium symbiont of Phacoides pectinatus]